MKIWFNGAVRSPRQLIDLDDRGFLLGDGAFDTVAVFGGRPAFLDAHIDRLRAGLKTLRLAPPAGLDRAREIIGELVRINNIDGDGAARITISRGPGPRGLKPPEEGGLNPSIAISVSPLAAGKRPQTRVMVSGRRRFSGSSMNGFKSLGGYGENILALGDAHAAGADDAILLNENGAAICATAANIFLINANGAATTPRLADGAMPGIVRGVILDAAGKNGIEVREIEITQDDLATGALFLTNSLIGLAEASLAPAFNRRMNEAPGAKNLFKRLQSWYGDALAADLAAHDATP